MNHSLHRYVFIIFVMVALVFSACVSTIQHLYIRPAEDGQMQYHIDPTLIRERDGKLSIGIDLTYRTRDETVSAPAYVNFTLHDKKELHEITGLSFVFEDGATATASAYRILEKNLIKNNLRIETTMSAAEFQKILDKIDLQSQIHVTYDSRVRIFPVTKTLLRKIQTAKQL